MEELLIEECFNTDFLKILQNNITDSGGSLKLAAGEGSLFKLDDYYLDSWQKRILRGRQWSSDYQCFKFDGVCRANYRLYGYTEPVSVIGDDGDHELGSGSTAGVSNASSTTLAVGSTTSSKWWSNCPRLRIVCIGRTSKFTARLLPLRLRDSIKRWTLMQIYGP